MRSLTADVNLLASEQVAGLSSSNLVSHGLSLIDTLRSWSIAAIGQSVTANIPARLIADVFGDTVPLRVENHVRDGFGRPVY